MRVIHLNSSNCDITDHEYAEAQEGETAAELLLRYIEEIGDFCIDEGDTFKIVE